MLAFKLIRDAIRGKLFADWESSIDVLAPNFDVPAAEVAKIRSIDWGGSKQQVYMGAYDISDLMDSSALVWPVVTISVPGASSPVDAKLYARFQGDASARLEMHYAWKRGRAVGNAEDAVDLICAALVATLLDPAWGSAIAGGVQWTAEASVSRSGVMEAADNWMQSVTFEMVFHIEE